MTRRRRYVSDAEARRLAKLAEEIGVRPATVRFFPDGVVEFDSAAQGRLAEARRGPADADEELDAWESGH